MHPTLQTKGSKHESDPISSINNFCRTWFVFSAGRKNRQTRRNKRSEGSTKSRLTQCLRKDVATLEKLWAENFTVNNPRSEITNGRKEVVGLIRNGVIDYSSFVREVETMLVHGDTVVLMGLETVTPANKAPLAGQTVRRQFTISG